MALENVVEGRGYNHGGFSKLCIYASFSYPSHYFTSWGENTRIQGSGKHIH